MIRIFVGRKTELQFLEDKYKSNYGELIVLYGRRRIGKTETLREFCKDKPHVFYSCQECSDLQQRRNFSEKILKTGLPASKYIQSFENWEQTFQSIIDIPFSEKILVVIDEFPYMCRGNNSIPSILQNLWDNTLKNSNVMIVLCGSAMSFIEKELLSEKNPLYGRATGIYKMKEMPFYDAIQFFPDYSDYDKILAYSILGGIPHYLNQFDPEKSLEYNIKKNILSKGCILYSEVEFLLRQELRETALYNSIIEAIALGNTSLNNIFQKTQIEKSKLSVYLKNLIDLEIIKREFSMLEGVKEQARSSHGLYKLTDHFFCFWYRFIFTNYSELENDDVEGVYRYSIQPQLHEYASFPFEEICIQYLREKNKKDQLPFHFTSIGRWWGKIRSSKERKTPVSIETEIDILAHDKTFHQFLLGECKFRNQLFSKADFNSLTEKVPPIAAGNECYYLFSLSGFSEQLASKVTDNPKIHLITLNDIIQLK